MKQTDKKQEYISILRTKAKELGRLPKKSDFEEFEVVQIKSFFGPWPRALEASGLIAEKSVRKRLKRGSDE